MLGTSRHTMYALSKLSFYLKVSRYGLDGQFVHGEFNSEETTPLKPKIQGSASLITSTSDGFLLFRSPCRHPYI